MISGNKGDGIYLNKGSLDVVAGNKIGTDLTGKISIGNDKTGVEITSGNSDTIGGTAVGARNVIFGNRSNGIYLNQGSHEIVLGNFIGTDGTGTDNIGNGKAGVTIAGGSKYQIGGTAPGARNVISGNSGDGIYIFRGSLDVVAGNSIGTNKKGTAQIPNGKAGVSVSSGKSDRIGGTTAGARQCHLRKWR